jgi:hypothetical protein
MPTVTCTVDDVSGRDRAAPSTCALNRSAARHPGGRAMWRLTMSRELGFWQGVLIAAIVVSAVIMIFLLREDGPGPR